MYINLNTITLFTLYRHPVLVLRSVKNLLAEYQTICAVVGEYRTDNERLRTEVATLRGEKDRISVLSRLYANLGSDGTQN